MTAGPDTLNVHLLSFRERPEMPPFEKVRKANDPIERCAEIMPHASQNAARGLHGRLPRRILCRGQVEKRVPT